MTAAVPELVMPFPPVPPNPACGSGSRELWAWVDAAGFAGDPATRTLLERADPELTTARYFPTAPPAEFHYFTRLMAWIFVNDDQFDDGLLGRDPAALVPAIESRIAVLDDGTRPGLFETALAELWARRPAGMSAGWESTFRADFEAFLRTYTVEAGERWAGRLPPLEEYLALRRDTAGTRWCADLVEVAAGVDLPEDVRRCRAYLALKDAAAEHCGLVNDLYSAHKELASGHVHNGVLLVMRRDGLDIEPAMRAVNDMATACVRAFDAAAGELPDTDAVHRWVTGVRHLVRGNVDWHLESRRYRSNRTAPEGSA